MSFGRKGLVSGDGAQSGMSTGRPSRAPIVPSASDQVFYDSDDAGSSRFDINDKKTWIFAAVILVFVIITLDDFFAHTSLITPINSTILWTFTGICAVIGFVLGVWHWLTSANIERGVRTTIAMFLGVPLFAGAWGNVTAWRMAEHFEFDFVDAAWQSADYPITSVHEPSRKRPFVRSTIAIDPFGAGEADLPIPDSQLDQLYYSYDGMCVTVMQRTSPGGAVQIQTSGSITGSEPPPQPVHAC